MDRLPMRPQYIMTMTTARLRGDRSRVMPVDSPTVLRAEKTSNSASWRGKGWVARMRKPPAMARVI